MNIRSLPQNEMRGRNRAHKRISPLATLPVFYRLSGKKVMVAGGSDAAAWKAELLAATGAEVHIFATEISAIFEALIAQPDSASQYIWHQEDWVAESFQHMQIAICDAETEDEAQAFYNAARSSGVAVNVIDKPEYCEFQFGSIVNRSPVVISISTDGAAPILGQAIRRRIESLIPLTLKPWAELARNIRSTINERLAMGAQRRAFWEAFVDRAFGPAPTDISVAELLAKSEQVSASHKATKGKITFIGVDPSDVELLTLKAVRALQAADVILFDNAVSDDVLELARREAKRILVDKKGGRESCSPEDINNTILKLVEAGKNVVHLRNGAAIGSNISGKEISHWNKEGISVNAVPAITLPFTLSNSTMAHQAEVWVV